MHTLYTIGHSTHPTAAFVDLLANHGINAVSDVRSSPFSRFNPQFNREVVRDSLRAAGIAYVWLGESLGARWEDPACLDEAGNVRFDLVARTERFGEGLERVRRGMQDYRVALMCAEKDPLNCHRTILVCRNLRAPEVRIKHIREDGTVETHADVEDRLLAATGLGDGDLFADRGQLIERAYDLRGQQMTGASPAG